MDLLAHRKWFRRGVGALKVDKDTNSANAGVVKQKNDQCGLGSMHCVYPCVGVGIPSTSDSAVGTDRIALAVVSGVTGIGRRPRWTYEERPDSCTFRARPSRLVCACRPFPSRFWASGFWSGWQWAKTGRAGETCLLSAPSPLSVAAGQRYCGSTSRSHLIVLFTCLRPRVGVEPLYSVVWKILAGGFRKWNPAGSGG